MLDCSAFPAPLAATASGPFRLALAAWLNGGGGAALDVTGTIDPAAAAALFFAAEVSGAGSPHRFRPIGARDDGEMGRTGGPEHLPSSSSSPWRESSARPRRGASRGTLCPPQNPSAPDSLQRSCSDGGRPIGRSSDRRPLATRGSC